MTIDWTECGHPVIAGHPGDTVGWCGKCKKPVKCAPAKPDPELERLRVTPEEKK